MELAIAAALVLGLALVAGHYLANRTHLAFARVADFDPPPERAAKSSANARNAAPPAAQNQVTLVHRLSGDPTFLSLSTILGLGFFAESVQFVRRRRKAAAEDEVAPDTDHSQLPLHLFEKRQGLLRRLTEAASAGKLHAVRTRDVMTTAVVTLSPYAPVEEVGRLMAERRVRHVLICSDDGRLMGVVSDRDVLQRRGRIARDIMSRRIVSVTGDTELIPAVTTMMNRGISALPILNDGVPIGILTTTDALLVLQCMLLLKHRDETPLGETL